MKDPSYTTILQLYTGIVAKATSIFNYYGMQHNFAVCLLFYYFLNSGGARVTQQLLLT